MIMQDSKHLLQGYKPHYLYNSMPSSAAQLLQQVKRDFELIS